jgi:hypothetical protein
MLQVGFEPTTQAFERAKTVHDLDRAATVLGFPRNRCAEVPSVELQAATVMSLIPVGPHTADRLPESCRRVRSDGP